MPLDPIVSLAVALAEAPGSCACLLGSGVSFDAGIPTASDILQDARRSLYRLETASEQSPDDEQLAAWLSEHGHEDLGYSSVLDLLAPDPAIRRNLLSRYFAGIDPGPAHERLAALAAAGSLRVFVTTNFDALLERALVARGVDPVVVSDDGTLLNHPRREHSSVFIVKAHGDYTQETIRNTIEELAELPAELARELRAIMDHYGLLVIGWSGRDLALGEIVRGRSHSRYGAWWLARVDPPSDPAPALIQAIDARVIVRPAGAAEFLAELERRLQVYRAHESGDDPGSVHEQVLTLIKSNENVGLDEILRRERWAFESVLETVRAEGAPSGRDREKHLELWERMAAATDRRVASLIPLALYRSDLLETAIAEHTLWASEAPRIGGHSAFVEVWRFPFWIIGMTLGGLALHLARYDAVRSVLTATWTDGNRSPHAFVLAEEMGAFVGRRFGPDPPPHGDFPAWDWLPQDLRSKEWLVNAYPDWLRRATGPERSFIMLSLLLYIAVRLRGEYMSAWWSFDEEVAERFAQRLHRDPALRRYAAGAVGVTLQDFDTRAPDILRHGTPDLYGVIGRVGNILEHGTSNPPPPDVGAAAP